MSPHILFPLSEGEKDSKNSMITTLQEQTGGQTETYDMLCTSKYIANQIMQGISFPFQKKHNKFTATAL